MRLRRGYSFPEVLFAVVVLGIGFIMIAAIFPAAISQSKLTSDETIAAAAARGAVNTLSRIADNSATGAPRVLRPTGEVAPGYSGEVCPIDTWEGWPCVRGNLIFGDDPRFAFVPLVRRDGESNPLPPGPGVTIVGPASSAQLYVIVVQCRGLNRTSGKSAKMSSATVSVPGRQSAEFDQYDIGLDVTQVTNTPGAHPYNPITNPNNLYPRQIRINKLTDNYQSTGVDVLEVDSNVVATGATQNLPGALAEGAYVICRRAHSKTGRFYVYRLGSQPDAVTRPLEWDLQPGSDMQDAQEEVGTGNAKADPGPIFAWVIGRERLPDGTFTGPAQDISLFTTFIKCNP